MKIIVSFLIILFSLFSQTIRAQELPTSDLTALILRNDSLLFTIGFNQCRIEVFEQLLSEDFEFYHDKSGFSDKTKFLSDVKNGLCADHKTYQSRRELVAESTAINGLYDKNELYGAIQEGEHVFYEKIVGKTEKLVGSARFTHVWLLEDGMWKLSRSLSFGHREIAAKKAITNAEIYRIGVEILENKERYEIWNLTEIDTNDWMQVTGNFTHPTTLTTMVLLQGTAGGSAGSADNLLILLKPAWSENENPVIWAAQTGDFSLSDVIDLTNDSIPEVIIQSGFSWMGHVGRTYEIVHFKGGIMNRLFIANSRYVSGMDDKAFLKHYSKGDTMEIDYECTPILQIDHTYAIKRTATLSIHNGGPTFADIKRRMRVSKQTELIELK